MIMQSGEERQEKRTATSGTILPEKNQNILHQILVTLKINKTGIRPVS